MVAQNKAKPQEIKTFALSTFFKEKEKYIFGKCEIMSRIFFYKSLTYINWYSFPYLKKAERKRKN